MIVFLDTNPVIYFVERPPIWGMKATIRIGSFLTSGDELALGDLVRMECLVGPLKARDTARERHFRTFFAAPHVRVLAITAGVADRAAQIRADYNIKSMDALQLATATEHGCDLFLTADAKLARFTDITVEILT